MPRPVKDAAGIDPAKKQTDIFQDSAKKLAATLPPFSLSRQSDPVQPICLLPIACSSTELLCSKGGWCPSDSKS